MNEIADFAKIEEQIAASLGHDIETLKEMMPQFTDENVEAFYTLAFDFYENGRFKEAVDFFRFLTTIDHMNKKNWLGLGAALQMQKEYEKAINAYTLAAFLDAKDPYIPFYAAECCISMGDLSRGMDALESADELADEENKFKGLKKQIAVLREAWLRSE